VRGAAAAARAAPLTGGNERAQKLIIRMKRRIVRTEIPLAVVRRTLLYSTRAIQQHRHAGSQAARHRGLAPNGARPSRRRSNDILFKPASEEPIQPCLERRIVTHEAGFLLFT